MYSVSQSDKTILKYAYHNYLENHTRECHFQIKHGDTMYLINALRALADAHFIRPISDNFYTDRVSIAPTYVFELTDDGINLAETLHL